MEDMAARYGNDNTRRQYDKFWSMVAADGARWSRIRRSFAHAPIFPLLRIWQKETLRAIFWAGILPVVIIAGGLLNKAAYSALLLYPAQISRISICPRPRASADLWLFATFMVLAKFPELQGVICYYLYDYRKSESGSL